MNANEDFEEIGRRIPGMVHHLTFKIHRRVYTFHPTNHAKGTIYPQYHIFDESRNNVGSLYVRPNNGSNCFDGVMEGEKIWISFDKVRRLVKSKAKAKPVIEPVIAKQRDGLTEDMLAKIRALPKIKENR